jgi:uncharacterized phage-associated protein
MRSLLEAEADVMPFSPAAIANYFLDKGEDSNTPLSSMKLQKLMYYAQGWSLAITDEPLFNEQIEAWQWGPVIRSVYHQFKEFGNSPITKRAKILQARRVDGHLNLRYVTPTIEKECDAPEKLARTKVLLNKIWDVYNKYSPIQLSNLTHEEGAPWDQIVKRYNGNPPKGTDIPQSIIKRYFKRLAQGNG